MSMRKNKRKLIRNGLLVPHLIERRRVALKRFSRHIQRQFNTKDMKAFIADCRKMHRRWLKTESPEEIENATKQKERSDKEVNRLSLILLKRNRWWHRDNHLLIYDVYKEATE